MRIHRIRNRLLQLLYRPPGKRGVITIPQKTLTAVDEIDKAIEKKITPLLAGLWDG